MLPVQPTPITTASTSFKSVAIVGLSLIVSFLLVLG
jgi:hypothetical protein